MNLEQNLIDIFRKLLILAFQIEEHFKLFHLLQLNCDKLIKLG